MNTRILLSAVAAVALATSQANAQLGVIGRAVGGTANTAANAGANIGANVQNTVPAVTNPALNAGAAVQAAVPGAAGANVNAGVGPNPNAWRYKYHNNQWWYYGQNNQWQYYNNGAWTPHVGVGAGVSVGANPYGAGYRGYGSTISGYDNPGNGYRYGYGNAGYGNPGSGYGYGYAPNAYGYGSASTNAMAHHRRRDPRCANRRRRRCPRWHYQRPVTGRTFARQASTPLQRSPSVQTEGGRSLCRAESRISPGLLARRARRWPPAGDNSRLGKKALRGTSALPGAPSRSRSLSRPSALPG